MAKGIARLGISLTLLLLSEEPCFVGTGEWQAGGSATGLITIAISNSYRFERIDPKADTGNRREHRVDGGCQRIETDLLILPAYLRKLAVYRPGFLAAGKVAGKGRNLEAGKASLTRRGMPT